MLQKKQEDMPDLIALSVFKSQLPAAIKPVVTQYNRLEGSPRNEEFEQSLRAEIRDPLWMLCRQWQFGEFQGENAGTAFHARISGSQSQPHAVAFPGGNRTPYAIDTPLEVTVERERLTPTLHLRAQMGRHFLALLKKRGLQAHKDLIADRYQLSVSPKTEDQEGLFLAAALNGRYPDGWKIYEAANAGDFLDWVRSETAFTGTDETKLADLQAAFLRWFERLYEQPAGGSPAWNAAHLEYNFSLEVGGNGERLIADQYASGRLEWYAFDQGAPENTQDPGSLPGPPPVERIDAFIPAKLQFKGMPHPRYWQMEEGLTDFGKIDASPTSLLNLLLAEYGLTYSNDWFILPYPMKVNTLCEINGIVVTDVFGFDVFVGPALKDPEMNWQEFAAFHQTERENILEPRNRFYLTPAVGKMLESKPLEKVNFMRDEMSNMVWAIENTVPSEAGGGREVVRNTPGIPPDFVPADNEALIRYVLGTGVPDNWIPFIPVQRKNGGGAISLQRARFPQAPGPQGRLLTETQPVFFIEEEEVPRAGAIVERTFQRTRWLNGKTCLWIGRRKTAGRGEGWSGLMFDQIVEIPR